MVFNPDTKDSERVCEQVENNFPDTFVQLKQVHGQDTVVVETTPDSTNPEQIAEDIQTFLEDKGLRTRKYQTETTDTSCIYEVSATTDSWN